MPPASDPSCLPPLLHLSLALCEAHLCVVFAFCIISLDLTGIVVSDRSGAWGKHSPWAWLGECSVRVLLAVDTVYSFQLSCCPFYYQLEYI
jgi:hypothetical protein